MPSRASRLFRLPSSLTVAQVLHHGIAATLSDQLHVAFADLAKLLRFPCRQFARMAILINEEVDRLDQVFRSHMRLINPTTAARRADATPPAWRLLEALARNCSSYGGSDNSL